MSQSNISKTDPIQINDLDEENISNHAGSMESDQIQINDLGAEKNRSSPLKLNFDFKNVTNPNEFNELYKSNSSNDSIESHWSTQGYLLGARTICPPPATVDTPIVPVLPRLQNNEMGGEECGSQQIYRGLQNADDDQESLDREDLSSHDDFDEEPRESGSALVIGRNHPASSQAASAGYRYRIR